MPTRNVPRWMISSSLDACSAHADVANDNPAIAMRCILLALAFMSLATFCLGCI
jgi:hypothetical protein